MTCPFPPVVLIDGSNTQCDRRLFMQAVEEKGRIGSEESADDVFDLVIGDLEQDIPPLTSPMNSGSGTSCGTCSRIYCC